VPARRPKGSHIYASAPYPTRARNVCCASGLTTASRAGQHTRRGAGPQSSSQLAGEPSLKWLPREERWQAILLEFNGSHLPRHHRLSSAAARRRDRYVRDQHRPSAARPHSRRGRIKIDQPGSQVVVRCEPSRMTSIEKKGKHAVWILRTFQSKERQPCARIECS
jgi:hypothetical protein